MIEKNKDILTGALEQLKSYTPADLVWDNIEEKLDDQVLQESLEQLKPIAPPEFIWNNIDNELSKQEKLRNLKQYDPPAEIWDRIDESLSETKIIPITPRAKIIRMMKWTAGVAAMLLFGLFLFKSININKTSISYSEEWIETGDFAFWEEEDLEVEAVLEELCMENPTACDNPEFKELKEELDFLEESKREILSQMSEYDENTELEIVLTKIELERNDLIKQMITEVMI
jgi:hypothetical protein